MAAQSTPPLRDVNADARSTMPDLDPDSADTPVEPVRPSEGPRQQALKMVPPPSKVMVIGGGIVAALAGGAVGYWLGKRHAPRPARPIRTVARTVDSVVDLAPVAMQLLANPLVRALAIRALTRQLSRRIDH